MTAKSRHRKALHNSVEAPEKLFRFVFQNQTVVVAGEDLFDAKCHYQDKYGEWPADA